MTVPSLRVELGFGSTWQTAPASITWTNVTPYVLQADGISTQRGASSARGQVDVGSKSLSLKNADRRFDPTYTAGPYYGNLKPGVPVRVYCSDDIYVPYYTASYGIPVWYGSVAKWPQRYDVGNRFAWVPVEAYDGFDKLSRAKIPRSVLEAELLVDSPTNVWLLDEQTGEVTTDAVGGLDLDLSADASTFTTSGLAEHSSAAMSFAGGYAQSTATPPMPAAFTVEAWLNSTDTTNRSSVFFDRGDGSRRHLVAIFVDGSGLNRQLRLYNGLQGSGSNMWRSDSTTGLAGARHVAVTYNAGTVAMYIDGVAQTVTLDGIGPPATSGVRLGTPFKTFDTGSWGRFDGPIDYVATFSSALSASRIAAHFTATAALNEQRTDQRIGYILDQIGWPTDLRSLEVGQTTLGVATFNAGDGALDYLRLVERSEDGLIFCGPDGKIRFLDRYWRYLNTLAATSQFTFTDANTARGYAEFELDLDDDLIVNVARFTRRNGVEQVATNTASVAAYGQAERQQGDLLQRLDVEVRSLAEWTVATQGTPLPRVPLIRVPLHSYSTADQATVLGLDLGHRVTVVRTPQGVGSAISLSFLIRGIRNAVGGGAWWWEAYVEPVPSQTAGLFVWDTSLWDSTDVWAF